MILQRAFKLTEAKSIGAKAEFGRFEDRLHPSCDTFWGNPNENIRRRWLVLRRSIRGHGDRPKLVGLYPDKRFGL